MCGYRYMRLEEGWAAIGERVRRARVAEGLSQQQLAREIGLEDRTAVSKIERGDRKIDGMELARLSRALNVPLDQFIQDPPLVISRRGGLVAEETTDAERAAFRIQTALVSWLNDVRQLRGLGLLRPPRLVTYPGSVTSFADARRAAIWLREHLKLGVKPTESLMSVAERIGLLYAVVELDGDGASLVSDEAAVSVIDLKQEFGRRRSTAAHELGHVFLGDEYSSEIAVHASKSEREALIDAFASEFLLPAAVLQGKAGRLSRNDLVGVAARYQVSWSLAIKQAETAGTVDEAQAKEWGGRCPTHAEFMDALGWVPRPDFESMRVSPLVAHAIMEAYTGAYIASGRAVAMLRGQINGVDALPEVDEEHLLSW